MNAATADGGEAIAIGYGSGAHGDKSQAIGVEAASYANKATAVGCKASAAGDKSTAYGNDSSAAGESSVAVGDNASAAGTQSAAYGRSANASGLKAIAAGIGAKATAEASAAFGEGAAATAKQAVALGSGAKATALNTVALGRGAAASASSSVAVGVLSKTVSGESSVSMGNTAMASNSYTVAVGFKAAATAGNSVALGREAAATAGNSVQIGAGTNTVANSLKFRNTTVVGGDGMVPFASLSGAYPEADGNQLSEMVTTLVGQVNGSNVVIAVTNYVSGAYVLDAAKLQIRELRDGQYRTVYNSRDEILLHLGDFETNKLNATRAELRAEIAAVLAEMQHDAWGRRTSTGNPAPSNTIYTTEPSFVFGGGLEYERIAVGAGAVGILAARGAPSYTAGDSGTFLFKDATGENYFGYSMTQGYAIGVPTDGILVEGQRVTLTYNIVGSCPIVMWCPALFPGCAQDITGSGWHQLNDEDGNPIEGAPFECAVDMESTPEVATVYIDTGANPTGFFSAWTSVPGKSSFKTNMPVDLDAAHGGGVLSSDGITVIVPQPDGTWRPANEN